MDRCQGLFQDCCQRLTIPGSGCRHRQCIQVDLGYPSHSNYLTNPISLKSETDYNQLVKKGFQAKNPVACILVDEAENDLV
jgi:hypothetical protein